MGIVLGGEARDRFNALREQDRWTDDDAAFEHASDLRSPISTELSLRFENGDGLRRVAATERPLDRGVLERVERWRDIPRDAQVGSKPITHGEAPPKPAPPGGTGGSSSTGEGSHSAPITFAGTTGNWDVVVQLHENLLARFSEVFFAAQALASAFAGGGHDTQYVDHRFTLETWMLKLIKIDLSFNTSSGSRLLTFDRAGDDEVGICMPVSVVTSSRWSASAAWEEDDRYEAQLVRYGKLTKTSSLTIGDDTLERLFTADLAGGRSVIDFGGELDSTRELLLSAALDAYFKAELPSYPVSFQIPNQPPFITWARASAFSRATVPDFNAFSVCYGDHGGSFRTYILNYGSNAALGISDGSMIHTVRAELPDVPYKQDGVTIESWDIALRNGHIEVVAKGFKKVLFKLGFTYKAEVTLAIRNDRLEGEVDKSKLKLPAWLWFLSAIFLGLPGIIVTAVAASIVKGAANQAIGDQLDLAAGTEGLFASFDNDLLHVVPDFNQVEINPNGVFLRGNIRVNPNE